MTSLTETLSMPTTRTLESPLLPWIVVFTASLFFFWEFLQLNMFNTLSPYLMQAFSINATQLGYLSGTFTLAEVMFLFPAGIMLDHFSTKKLILIALGLGVISTVAFALASNFYFACFTHFVAGYGAAFCFLSNIKLATRWFPPRRLALVIGLIVTVAMLGGVASQTPLNLLCEKLGWRLAVLVNAGLGGLIMGLIVYVVRDYPTGNKSLIEAAHRKLQQIGFWSSIALALKNSQNWLCGLYTSVLNLPLALLGALWGELYLNQVHHFPYMQASLATTMLFVGTIIGSPTLGWFSDKIGRRRLPMIAGAALSLVFFLIMNQLQTPTLFQFMVLFFLLGFITSTQVISYPVITESNPAHLAGSSLGIASTIIIAAYPISQTLFGWLMDLHWDGKQVNNVNVYSPENFHLALMILPIGFLIGFFASGLIKETFCKPQQ